MPKFAENLKKLNVLLINPSAMPYGELISLLSEKSNLRIPSCGMPLGLIEIAAYLRKKDVILEIQVIDLAKEVCKFYLNLSNKDPISYLDFINRNLDEVKFVPDIVGISTMFNSTRKSSLEIATAAKEKWSGCTTMLGGNVATGQYKNLIENDCIDYIARGEGEIALHDFIVQRMQGIDKPQVNGILDRSAVNPSFHVVNIDLRRSDDDKSTCQSMTDMTQLALPAYDLLDLEFYKGDHHWGRGCLIFSRGCPFRCTFCGSKVIHGRLVRHKSIEQCVAETKFLLDNGFRYLSPEDDIWAVNPKKHKELVDRLCELKEEYDGEIRFNLSQGLSVAVMDEDRMDDIVRMGCKGAQLAIESGSPYVQKHIIKKNVDLVKARKVLDYMRKIGFKASVNFILGYPGETAEMRQETIDYMKTLDVDWVYVFNCAPIKGTDLFAEFEKIADVNEMDWDNMRMGKRTFDTTELTAEEIENIVYDANIDVNFFNNSNFRNGKYELAIKEWNEMVLKDYPYHIVGRYCRAMAYKSLNKFDEMGDDLISCVEWTNSHLESKRLYDRYKRDMPELNILIENNSETVQNMAS